MTAAGFAFACAGWVLFLSLVAVYLRDDKRADRLDAENADLRRKMAVLSGHPSTTGRG